MAKRNKFMSSDGKFIYHISIIDYLQDYDVGKWSENAYKSLISDGKLISCVPPEPYCSRFFDFMQSHVVIDQCKFGA